MIGVFSFEGVNSLVVYPYTDCLEYYCAYNHDNDSDVDELTVFLLLGSLQDIDHVLLKTNEGVECKDQVDFSLLFIRRYISCNDEGTQDQEYSIEEHVDEQYILVGRHVLLEQVTDDVHQTNLGEAEEEHCDEESHDVLLEVGQLKNVDEGNEEELRNDKHYHFGKKHTEAVRRGTHSSKVQEVPCFLFSVLDLAR